MKKRPEKSQAKSGYSKEEKVEIRTPSDFADFLLRFSVEGLSNGESARAYAIATSVMLKRAYGDEIGELFYEMTDDLVMSQAAGSCTLYENGEPELLKYLCCWLRERLEIEPSIGEEEKGKYAKFLIPPDWSFEKRHLFYQATRHFSICLPNE